MKNKEFFKEEIFDLACEAKIIAVDKRTNTPCDCASLDCANCAFYKKCMEISYSKSLHDWCNEEHEEPCPFEKDELVEVSITGKDWCLRHFSHINEEGCYKFSAFDSGLNSENTKQTSRWKYCQKYGTLGGFVKGGLTDGENNKPALEKS